MSDGRRSWRRAGSGRDSALIVVRRRRSCVAAGRCGNVAIGTERAARGGDAAALGAIALGANGERCPVPDVAWASSDSRIATVEPLTGWCGRWHPGTVLILVDSGEESRRSELTVLPGAVAALQILGARPMAVARRSPSACWRGTRGVRT